MPFQRYLPQVNAGSIDRKLRRPGKSLEDNVSFTLNLYCFVLHKPYSVEIRLTFLGEMLLQTDKHADTQTDPSLLYRYTLHVHNQKFQR